MAIFTWTPEQTAIWKEVDSPDRWIDSISVTVSDESEEGTSMFPPRLESIVVKIEGLSDDDSSDEDFNDPSDAEAELGGEIYDVSEQTVKQYLDVSELFGIGEQTGGFKVKVQREEGLTEIFPMQKLSYSEGEGESRTTHTVHTWKDLPPNSQIYEYIPYPKNVRNITIVAVAYANDGTQSAPYRAVIRVTHSYDAGKKIFEEKLKEYEEYDKKQQQESGGTGTGSGTGSGSGAGSSGESGTGGSGSSGGSSSSGGNSGSSNGSFGHGIGTTPAVVGGGGGLGVSSHVTFSTGHEGFPATASVGPVSTSEVILNNKKALMATATGTHFKLHKRPKHKVHPQEIRFDTEGQPMILIDNLPAVRIGDPMADGDKIATGSPDVIIGF